MEIDFIDGESMEINFHQLTPKPGIDKTNNFFIFFTIRSTLLQFFTDGAYIPSHIFFIWHLVVIMLSNTL